MFVFSKGWFITVIIRIVDGLAGERDEEANKQDQDAARKGAARGVKPNYWRRYRSDHVDDIGRRVDGLRGRRGRRGPQGRWRHRVAHVGRVRTLRQGVQRRPRAADAARRARERALGNGGRREGLCRVRILERRGRAGFHQSQGGSPELVSVDVFGSD